MDKNSLTGHISSQFNEELQSLRNQILRMGGLVEQALKDGLNAVIDVNTETVQSLFDTERLINEAEVQIDEECSQIIVRRQPAAGGLRVILMISKLTTDLERIGDEVIKLAHTTITLSESDFKAAKKMTHRLRHLGDHVSGMIRMALDSFARMDVDMATQVWHEDQIANEEYEALVRGYITNMMEDPRTIKQCIDLLWVARSLERIGDHTKNIGEYVVYIVKGVDIRHVPMPEAEKELGISHD